MSFNSDGQSQHSSVPPSAQPYQSLFGGYSQETQDLERYPPLEQDEYLNQSTFGATASGGRPVNHEDSDDDLDYIQTSDREPSPATKRAGSVASSFVAPALKSRASSQTSASPPPDRPNKFHGPDSLWLDLTRDDREIAESLNEIEARDLAAHLYNAQILQSRGVPHQRNDDLDQLDEEEPRDDDFLKYDLSGILDEWTAWPMPGNTVPRADERLRRLEDDKWTFRMRQDSRPSASLEESITSFLMRIAKERFWAREWAPSNLPDRMDSIHSGVEPRKFKPEEDMDLDQLSADQATDWESEQESPLRPLRPIVQIDDEESRYKLRPLARNVITQFEQVLAGLHRLHGASQPDIERSNRSRSRGRKRARSTSLGHDMSSAHEANVETEVTSATNKANQHTSAGKKAARKTTAGSFSRGRKRTRRASQSSQQHNSNAHTSKPRAYSTTTKDHEQSGLTDWRDVVGIASLTGVPPTVLQRATQRFQSLVGEDAEFPSITEDHTPRYMEDVLEWTFTQDKLAALTRPEATTDDSVKRGQQLMCPFKGCSRHTNGFSRQWNLNQHLKNMHSSHIPKDHKSRSRSGMQSGYDTDRSTAVHDSADEELPLPGHGAKKGHKLFCPIKGCNRHKKKGFSRQWNLNQHLKTMHPSYKLQDSISRSRSRVHPEGDSDGSQ